MTWLLALPAWIKVAVGSLAIIGLLQVQHYFQVRGLRNDIKTLTQSLKDEQTANATLRVQVANVVANRNELAGQIAGQNAKIAALQLSADRAKAAADAATIRALRAGEAASRALLAGNATPTAPPTSPGPEEFNRWMSEQFSQQ